MRSRDPVAVEATVCHVIGPKGLLLKKALRGFSKGKWNAPGGKLEAGERAWKNAKREVFEETGLKIRTMTSHGTIRFFMNGTRSLPTIVHVFSTRDFTGTPRSSAEGPVRWFDLSRLPFDKMWEDAKYWFGLMLSRSEFNARFYYAKGNGTVKRFEITRR